MYPEHSEVIFINVKINIYFQVLSIFLALSSDYFKSLKEDLVFRKFTITSPVFFDFFCKGNFTVWSPIGCGSIVSGDFRSDKISGHLLPQKLSRGSLIKCEVSQPYNVF